MERHLPVLTFESTPLLLLSKSVCLAVCKKIHYNVRIMFFLAPLISNRSYQLGRIAAHPRNIWSSFTCSGSDNWEVIFEL